MQKARKEYIDSMTTKFTYNEQQYRRVNMDRYAP